MAKAAYIGVGNIAKKIKNCYIGVDNVAKKVSKAYIGIGGLARLWWSSEVPCPLVYVGRLTDLAVGRDTMGVATNANYIFFAGGSDYDDEYIATVEKYNASGTRSTCSNLTTATNGPVGGTVGKYAIFAGGSGNSAKAVQGYNLSGTKSTATAMSQSRGYLRTTGLYACTFNNKFTIMWGNIPYRGTTLDGSSWSGSITNHTAECYSTSLTKSTISNLLQSQIGGSSYYLYAPATGMPSSSYLITGCGTKQDKKTGGEATDIDFYNMYSLNTGFTASSITGFPTNEGLNPVGIKRGHNLSTGTWFIDTGYDDDWRYDKNLVQTRIVNTTGAYLSYRSYPTDGPIVVGDHLVGMGEFDGQFVVEDTFIVMDNQGVFSYCETLPTEVDTRDARYITLGGWGNKLYAAGGREGRDFMEIVDLYEIIS